MHRLSRIIFFVPVLCVTLSHAGGIQIGRTRIIYDANKKEIALPLKNEEKELPWLIQSWTDTGDGKTRGPFIVTPPLFRLDAQKEQTLRITWNGTLLPQGRESLFYMNVRTIPASAESGEHKNVLRLIYKTRLKLFWRPKNLQGTPAETCKNLHFIRRGNLLTAINDGAFYSVFDSLQLGNIELKDADMVAPKSRLAIPLPQDARSNSISWRCITDYGSASDKHSALLTLD